MERTRARREWRRKNGMGIIRKYRSNESECRTERNGTKRNVRTDEIEWTVRKEATTTCFTYWHAFDHWKYSARSHRRWDTRRIDGVAFWIKDTADNNNDQRSNEPNDWSNVPSYFRFFDAFGPQVLICAFDGSRLSVVQRRYVTVEQAHNKSMVKRIAFGRLTGRVHVGKMRVLSVSRASGMHSRKADGAAHRIGASIICLFYVFSSRNINCNEVAPWRAFSAFEFHRKFFVEWAHMHTHR